MAILKIVPEEVYQVLMEYLSDSDVVLLPESVLAGFSPEIQRKFRRMDQEGQIDYDFGGDPDVYVDVIRSDWCYLQLKRQISPWWAKNLRPPQNRLSRIPLRSWASHRAQLKSRSKLQEISPQR